MLTKFEYMYARFVLAHLRRWSGEIAHKALGLGQYHSGITLFWLELCETDGHGAGQLFCQAARDAGTVCVVVKAGLLGTWASGRDE